MLITGKISTMIIGMGLKSSMPISGICL